MRERPILFSGPMVRAILSGQKTQTRRAVKPQPPAGYPVALCDAHGICAWGEDGTENGDWWPDDAARCPYGQPGDRLWVRETWCPLRSSDYAAAPRSAPLPEDRAKVTIAYQADHIDPRGDAGPLEWRSPLFLPRWASRLTLEIEAVRVERLQEISHDDAAAEGMYTGAWRSEEGPKPPSGQMHSYAVERFRRVWDAINGKRAPWASNPWVWVVTFRSVETVGAAA